MSYELQLAARDLQRLALFLTAISEATKAHAVRLDAYGPIDITIDDTTVSITWDTDRGEYIVSTRAGS